MRLSFTFSIDFDRGEGEPDHDTALDAYVEPAPPQRLGFHADVETLPPCPDE